MKTVYLDHTATTPLDPLVARAMEPFFAETFGNASSVHSFGRAAKQALEGARAIVAAAIGASPGEVIFTSGGTEADNLAITGVMRAARAAGKNHVVTSAAEHHAVLDTCTRLAGEGYEVTVLPVDAAGLVSPERLAAVLTPRTALVSLMHGNNEVGSLAPIAKISALVHSRGALLHTDAVQTVGKIPLDVDELGADLMSLSAHKVYGPKGIGVLYLRRGVAMEPMMRGGGQERGRRPGTENVPLAVGCAEALRLAVEEREAEADRLRGLRDALQKELIGRYPGLLVNGHPRDRLPHILNVSFDSRTMPMEGEMLVPTLDLLGIAVTSGSACTSGSLQPSHVLLAMGRDEATARATLRFSFGKGNTADEVPVVAEALTTVVARMTLVR